MTEQPSKKIKLTVKLLLKAGGALIGGFVVINGALDWKQLKVVASSVSNEGPKQGISSSPPPVNSTNRTTKISVFADKPASNGQNNFIDTNNYGTPQPPSPESPTVIFSERTKDCQTVINNQEIPKINCTAKPPKPVPKPADLIPTAKTKGAPLTVARLGDGKTSLLFPLPTPMPISSGFGWRTNPFTGLPQLHEGTDLAAPIGTPILAAYPGKVEVARNLDGYGLVIYLRHEKDTQESRYAHLSSILVREGEWVRQGEVIGLVGNTGLSSGPHLHFEWRYLINHVWVAVDAKLNLEYALNNLSPTITNVSQPNNSVVPAITPGDYRRAPRGDNKPLSHKTVMVSPVSLPQAISEVFDWSVPLIQATEASKPLAALPSNWKKQVCGNNPPDSTIARLNCSLIW